MDEARARRLTLIACILGSAVVFVDQTVVNLALPSLREDLGATLAGQQWAVEAYLLLLGSLVLVGGTLGDLYGRRRIFAVGVAGFGAASLVCAAAPSVGLLVAARALQGAFGALLVPSSLAIITNVFTGPDRAAAIGSWTAGGFLVDAFSWRVIFALNVPLVLVCLTLIVRAVPECPGSRARRIDVPGVVLCVLGLAGPVYALIEQPALGWSDPRVWAVLVGGIGACVAFVAYERVAPDPMLPPSIFRTRNFAVGNLVTLVVYAGLTAATFFVALFLQQVAGYSALQAGFALLPITLMLIALSRRFGELSARLGPRLLMSAGPVAGGIGMLAFARLDARADYVTGVLPAGLVLGLGLAMTVAPLTAAVLEAADPRYAGIASGVNNAVARAAGLLAIAAVGAIVAAQLHAGLDRRLAAVVADPAARAYVRDARERPLTLPDGRAPAPVRAAVRAANVDAFRTGMIVSGMLMIAGGLVAAVGIENPRRRVEATGAEAGAAAAAG
jgi:EmrB/QacA subfamily drug resistance transporter